MSAIIRQKDGRRWTVDGQGISNLRRQYTVELDSDYLAANGEGVSFTGVPAIGSAHPSYPGLIVRSYEVEEGEGGEKKLLRVTVNYETSTSETSGEGDDEVALAVESWGWDDALDERELVTAVNGVAVLNSAGDPFESVPSVSVPAPTFTKVMKFAARQAGWGNFLATINGAAVSIGGIQFPKWTLLCSVGETRIFGDPLYNYRYQVRLRYRTNMVKLYGSGSAQEIGWNVSITDAGMRELGSDGKPVLIRTRGSGNSKPCAVTSPELLDGQGHAIARTQGSTPVPYNGFFQAYAEATWPAWFYSEPALPT